MDIGVGVRAASPRDENFLREGGARLGRMSSVCLCVCSGGPEKGWSGKQKLGQKIGAQPFVVHTFFRTLRM